MPSGTILTLHELSGTSPWYKQAFLCEHNSNGSKDDPFVLSVGFLVGFFVSSSP